MAADTLQGREGGGRKLRVVVFPSPCPHVRVTIANVLETTRIVLKDLQMPTYLNPMEFKLTQELGTSVPKKETEAERSASLLALITSGAEGCTRQSAPYSSLCTLTRFISGASSWWHRGENAKGSVVGGVGSPLTEHS